jgi:hypothetical protein
MRIYAEAKTADLYTVKRQGQKVAQEWQAKRGLTSVIVRAIITVKLTGFFLI